MNMLKRWRVVLGLAAVPILGGCMSAGYPSSTMAYSGYYGPSSGPGYDSGYGPGYNGSQDDDVSIGVQISMYPDLVPIPGYPVYYAPNLAANYFFYDGLYWVFWNDGWYAGSWYNGPWVYVAPESVPLFILRVPIRYYRYPPIYFRAWRPDGPPHWAERWGPQWEQHRSGWDHWNRADTPRPAPLPLYQRQYSGPRYPHLEQQQELRRERYGYRPHDPVGRQLYQNQFRGQPNQRPEQRGVAPAPQHVPERRDQPMYPNQLRMPPNERPEQRGFGPVPQGMPQGGPQGLPPGREQPQRESMRPGGSPAPVQPPHDMMPYPMMPQREMPGGERTRPVPPPNQYQRQDERRGEPRGQQPGAPQYLQPGQGGERQPQRGPGQQSNPRDKGGDAQGYRGGQHPEHDDHGQRDRNP